jgi:hypothetical protein
VRRLLVALALLALLAATAPAAGDVHAPSPPDRSYALVLSGTSFNGMRYPDTPLLEAFLGQSVMFTVTVPATAEPHTFHLHGHPWSVASGPVVIPPQIGPAPATIVDNVLLEPGDVRTFTVTAGGIDLQPGDWMYHCHFDAHMAAGMWGIFRVYPYTTLVEGVAPAFTVKLDQLDQPVDGATLTATLDGQPLPAHAVALGGGEYLLHTALGPATRGVLVVTARAAVGVSVARVGLGGAPVPQPTPRSEAIAQGLPSPAGHAHGA